jgi:integrase/recombinase XerD
MISLKEVIMRESKTRLVWTPESQAAHQGAVIDGSIAAIRAVLRTFAEWLKDVRGLCPGSITLRLGSASLFLEAVSSGLSEDGAQALRLLRVEQIEGFFVRYCSDHGPAARRSMRSAMRSILEFAAWQGWLGRELVEAVPSLRSYRLSGLPRGVSDEQVATLVGARWESGECRRRDRAIVVLLASYGVRGGQISALRLADIDWNERTIDFAAHTGGKGIRHELTHCVAEALADYLRNERPASACDFVFLRARLPHVRLGPGAISMMVTTRMVRCGLPPRGPHAFRHAYATRLLRAGQDAKAIADLLGHRSLNAVAVYAKVDHARLVEVAVDWPEAVS